MTDIETRILAGLNESQREAVTAINGPLMVIAGPGTGKTLTIVRRIAYLVHRGAHPGSILAVTFTNRAAQEMRGRTGAVLGKAAGGVFIGTFHMLGLAIIRDNKPGNLTVCTREEQVKLLKTVLDDPGRKAEEAADSMSRFKNLLEDGDEKMRALYDRYQAALRSKDLLDLDDLILTPMEMLSDHALLQRYRDRFRHIIVDEYQDINPAQYRFLRLLAGEGGNICVVGDADQAIYAFRGADVTNFLNFEKDLPGARRITLSHNYRSTAVIVNASDAMIEKNAQRIERTLSPVKKGGVPITIASVPDERAEGEFIVSEIEARIGGTSHYRLMNARSGDLGPDATFAFSDFTVIFRTNAQAEALGEVFRTSGIPYQIIGGRYQGKRKDIAEIADRIREYAAGDGVTTLTGTARSHSCIMEVLEGLAAGSKDPFYLSLYDLMRFHIAEGNIRTIDDCLNMLSLLTPLDDFDALADCVTLMTLHGAKGLEFRVVFITGAEDGLIPYSLRDGQDDREEERRLFYVGMTRAKEELFLLHARSRALYGRNTAPLLSPFVRDIPEVFTRTVALKDRARKRHKKQMKLF